MPSLASNIKKGLESAYKEAKVPINMNTMDSMRQYTSKLSENEKLEGGVADDETLMDIAFKHAFGKEAVTTAHKINSILGILKSEMKKGIKVEMEHTKDPKKAKEIVMDHLSENPHYYSKLKKVESKEATSTAGSGSYETMFGGDSEFWKKSESENPKLEESMMSSAIEKIETKEATGSGSVGGYETPAMWAKSTKRKDWGPSRKTQVPGGSFVKVKKKCTKFPYCNQGDIKALKLSKSYQVAEAIDNVAKRTGLNRQIIENIVIEQLSRMYKTK